MARVWWYRLRWAIPVLIVLAFLVAPPWTVLGKTRLVGYAICHQLPEHSIFVGGEQLPLCARCSGTFLGALAGFTLMSAWGRRRAANLPPLPILVALIGFIGLWGFDGVNSYLTFFPNLPHLYQPQNWLRLTTGTLNGFALSSIIFPVLNFTLWQTSSAQPVIRNLKELGIMLAVGAGIVVAVWLELPPLLYPLAILSTLGVVLMLGAVNTVLLLAVIRQERAAGTWRQAAFPLAIGLAAAFLEIGAIDAVRMALTRALGLPFGLPF